LTKKAYEIAKRDLRSCYGSKGIFAGSSHFRNYWSRDSFFASIGALELKDYKIVKKNLLTFLEFSKKVSEDKLLVPLRIGDKNISLSFLGLHSKKLEARYKEDKSNCVVIDGNMLYLIIYSKYIRKSKDREFYKNTKDKVKKILNFCLDSIKNTGLLKTGDFATWHDSIKKSGFTLYNNILFYYSLIQYYKLEKDKKIFEIAKKLKIRINEKFWNGNYYSDWIIKNKQQNYFIPFENLLSILFEIADKNKSEKILDYLENTNISKNNLSHTNHQKYPLHEQSKILTLFGMGDYQNKSISWLFIPIIEVIVKKKLKRNYKPLLNKISDLIIKYDAVYETYHNNKPLKRLFYKSEKHFAWSSGFFVYLYNQLKK